MTGPDEDGIVLSVVLPSYKVAPYLNQCITSLLDDAPPGMEVIVVDDGSPDDTGAVAEARAADEPRVRVIHHQVNAGCSVARNTGLKAARGTYVGFVDPDDVVEPGWARLLLEAGSRQRAAIIKGEAHIQFWGRVTQMSGMCRAMRAFTPLHWLGWMWSAIYRRDFLLGHGLHFPAGCPYAEDIDFQVRSVVAAMLAREPFAVCEQAVYRYQRRDGSQDAPLLSTVQIAGALFVYLGLHKLLSAHVRQLPAQGVGYQYFYYIQKLYVFALRARRPEDADAARRLAERLIGECPVPEELARMRQLYAETQRRRAELRQQRQNARAGEDGSPPRR